MKLFYTAPVVNAEMLVMMLEKHGIAVTQAFVGSAAPDDGDLSRRAISSHFESGAKATALQTLSRLPAVS